MILLSTNDSIHHIPRPQMKADTQTSTEMSFLLLPGLGPTGFEPKQAGEDRKLTGLHRLGLRELCRHTDVYTVKGTQPGRCHWGGKKQTNEACAQMTFVHLCTITPALETSNLCSRLNYLCACIT